MDTVVQWNVRGFRNNFEELNLLLNRSQSVIVALQECRLGDGQSPPRGYTLLLPQGGPPGRGGPPHQKRNTFFKNWPENWPENWPVCCSCHNKPGKD
ncbi:hypothetical protein PoB_004529000 [Plakobranchus ocellatus]|uniref:Endonuclease/exonuclease/phosphatase domain-containing protein n=1 Tax=Plakobranchus ocellatus TaxID=259542 RepID=A0AAV4BGX5_9GAST|nr:hypothetical protein PoB_004529000 [Plakobranchus ocellatus]